MAGAVALITVVLVAVLVSALSQPRTPSLPPPEPASVAATPAPIPVTPTSIPAVSVYREAVVGAPATLNPLLATSDSEYDVARLVFAGLTRPDGKGGVLPDLAERWTISPEGKVYTFELRPDAVWHDGQPVTARDVLFTVRLMQDASFPGNRTLTNFWRTVQVDVLSGHSVRFTLSEPYAPFLSSAAFPLLPAHLLQAVYPADLPRHRFSQQPIGAGPFKVVDAPREGELALERHERYFGVRPGIDRLLVRYYARLDEALMALRQGIVDGLAGVPAARLADVRDSPGLRVHSAPLNGYSALVFNLRRPLFQQREVRRAVALALDRSTLVNQTLDGAAQAGTGPIVPTSWAYDPAALTGNVHEARALLEQGGWFDRGSGVREREGRSLSVTLLTTDSAERTSVAAELARQLRAVGMKVTVSALPASELISRHLAPHDFDLVLFGWIALGDDPDIYGLWHSSQAEQGFNFAGWSLPRADELLEAGRVTVDQATRRARYAEFQRLFADEAPSIVLYYPQFHFVVADRVHNIDLGPLNRPADRYRSVARWTIEPVQAVG
jgi:peptide/nickel transport system substrate-binding protein